jgi:predicted nucleic acid-binding protein
MTVVSDTSPLNYLIQIDAIGVLPSLFGQVIVPHSIVAELRHSQAPAVVQEWATAPPSWLEVRDPASREVVPGLGVGESDAIALALELRADQLLVDDLLAREVAAQLGLALTGTLAVVVEAGNLGLINLDEAVTRLKATNFRASEDVWQAVLSRARPTS